MTSLLDDPIIAEVRRIRDELARAHGYDPEAIVAMLRREQTKHGALLVAREPKRLDDTDIPLPAQDAR